jgi:hypothetical protein
MVYVGEAPESIDRSSNAAYQADGDRFEPGETLRFKRATWSDLEGPVYAFRVNESSNYREKVGPATRIDSVNAHARWTAGTPGRYEVWTVPRKPAKTGEMPGEKVTAYTVESGDGNRGEETVGSADDWTNVDSSTQIDPSNYAGIVNADNEQGIALAPSLRREGASLGSDGATVTLPDGETVEVGAISEADEVARYTSGSNAGDIVDADQDAANTESSTNSDAIGASGTILGALALAYMIYRRQ